MATTSIVALFKDRGDAESAVRSLKSARFESARVGVVPPGEAHTPPFGKIAAIGVLGGALGCAVVGVVIGAVVAHYIHQGWFVPFMFGVTGAATGLVAGLLVSQSAGSQGTLYYEEEVEAGRTLVTVTSELERAEEARRILLQEGAFEAAPMDAPRQKAS